MFCLNCGKELLNDAKFCVHCGAHVETDITLQNDNNLPQATPVISKSIPLPQRKSIPTKKQRAISVALGTFLFLLYWIAIDKGMHGLSPDGTETGRLILYSTGYFFWYFWKIAGRNKWVGAIFGVFIAIAVLLAGSTIRAAHIRNQVDTNQSASAEWIKVYESEQATVYANPNREHTGSIIKMWNIMDYYKPVKFDKILAQSIKNEFEYDCIKKQFNLITTYAYSDKMASGTETYLGVSPIEWKEVKPDSTGSALFNFACN